MPEAKAIEDLPESDGLDTGRPHLCRFVLIASASLLILTISACSVTKAMPIIDDNPLSYADRLDDRSLDSIDLVVIHATELPDLATAREYGERIHYQNSRTGNSGHYYIDRDGSIHQWVPLDRVAHHVRGFNERSVGIELVNLGRYPDWLDSRQQDWQEGYSDEQIAALVELLRTLESELPKLRFIAGHDELDTDDIEASDDASKTVRRKVDPGPRFPWSAVEQEIELEHAPVTLIPDPSSPPPS